ncbi:hypothetical protein SLA2020_009510 [Shorea laevis]
MRNKMERCGLKLDVVTYNVLISGLCSYGNIGAALELYQEMKQNSLWPNATTYIILVDAILTKWGCLVEGDVILKDLKERGIISCDWKGSTKELHKALRIAIDRLKHIQRNRSKSLKTNGKTM